MDRWRHEYHTTDEMQFLRDMHERNRDAYEQYAALIRSGRRAYDATVDRAVVLAELARLERNAQRQEARSC